jgi:hypothetical protein
MTSPLRSSPRKRGLSALATGATLGFMSQTNLKPLACGSYSVPAYAGMNGDLI